MRKRWKMIETKPITIHKLYLIFQGFSCMEIVVAVISKLSFGDIVLRYLKKFGPLINRIAGGYYWALLQACSSATISIGFVLRLNSLLSRSIMFIVLNEIHSSFINCSNSGTNDNGKNA